MTTSKETATFDLSQADPNNNIILSVDAGDGQVDYSAFQDFNGNYAHGIIQNQIIGKVADGRGKTLVVTTLVADTNPNSNFTSLVIIVNGQQFPLAPVEAEKDKGIVMYVTSIKFKYKV